jgi:hypothetical protein
MKNENEPECPECPECGEPMAIRKNRKTGYTVEEALDVLEFSIAVGRKDAQQSGFYYAAVFDNLETRVTALRDAIAERGKDYLVTPDSSP